MTLILGAVQLGLLYAMMAMGVYISFRILNIPDLTVDGSFTLGMSVCVMVTAAGYPALAIFASLLAGAMAGLCTGLLQTKLRIHPILSGILTMTALYSINLFIMGGKSNVSLTGTATLFSLFQKAIGLPAAHAKLILLSICAALLTVILSLLFKTRTGLEIRATGDNEEMVRSSSINATRTKCLGLMAANACVALSGGMLCQYQSFSDVGFGSGMVVVGLASVIIGEAAFGRRGVTIGLLCALFGAAAYQLMIALALKIELLPAYGLKFLSAAIVAVSLCVPVAQKAIKGAVKEKGGAR